MPQDIAVQIQQIQREKKVSILAAAGSAIKADTKPKKVILSHPQQATEHYTAKKNLVSMLQHKCNTMAKHIAIMSSQSHPQEEIVF